MLSRMDQRVNQLVAAQMMRLLSESGADSAAMADALDMSETTLARRLTSQTIFTIAEIARAAMFLGCTLADLIPSGATDPVA